MRVLITGAAGYVGRRISRGLEADHDLRLCDLSVPDGDSRIRRLDVTRLDDVIAAMQGVEKMRANLALGLAQGVFLPHPRPDRKWLTELGTTIEQLSDFEPKGAACRAFGVYHPAGFPQRALVIVGGDGVVAWSYQAPSPGELPGANLIFDGLQSVGA